MKSLTTITLVAILTGVGSVAYMDRTINSMLQETPRDYGSSSLSVVNDKRIQPFGEAQEDEYTATQALDPTHQPQVTLHGNYVQSSASPQVTGRP